MSQYGHQNRGGVSAVLAGKNAAGEPLRGHRHAFYLSSDEDGDGLLDSIFVYARDGFNELEVRALANLRRLYAGGRYDLALTFLGTGERAAEASGGLFGPAREWESFTPFILSRHPKARRAGEVKLDPRGEQLDGPIDQIRREWERRRQEDPSLPGLLEVSLVPAPRVLGDRARWSDFASRRPAGGGDRFGLAGGFRLTLDRDVSGPIALGYGCHYGLGVFVPARGIQPKGR